MAERSTNTRGTVITRPKNTVARTIGLRRKSARVGLSERAARTCAT
jgi:hypothetical protein